MLGADISDDGLQYLRNLRGLRGFENILGKFTDKGIENISQIDTLTDLNVSSNELLTDASLQALSHLPYLQNLNVSRCRSLTQESLKLIQKCRNQYAI
eukprot:TRINITY_DN16723_c0_g1_i1.p1 TRINITY_DN16723_c0_g1~~TRINITY_DN16723_c0_g1_i1.p1  ORF type:complete len:113 (-),score=11.23 TRINITY_DN16723_c0_g1_i1:95-388(-)